MSNTPVLVVYLPIELTNGNDGRSKRWFKSAKERQKYEQILRERGHVRQPFSGRVSYRVNRILGKRQQLWDPSSWGRGNWKEIEDAMVACGWFHDDGPTWIADPRFRQVIPKDRDKPGIIVEVFEDP